MDVSTVMQRVGYFSNGDSDSRSALLVQIFTSAACRLFSIAGENAQVLVVTMLKNSILQLRIFSVKQCYCALFICCSFHGNKQEALQSDLPTLDIIYLPINLITPFRALVQSTISTCTYSQLFSVYSYSELKIFCEAKFL